MSFSSLPGIILATTLTTATMTGITTLIALDFKELKPALVSLFAESAEDKQKRLENALNKADDITFFKHASIDGTDLKVTTGGAFASADDIIKGRTKNMWCYLATNDGVLKKQINLGNRTGQLRPSYANLSSVPDHEVEELGLTSYRLEKIARSHCQFDSFDPLSDDNE